MKKIMIAVDAGGSKTKVCGFLPNATKVYESLGGPGAPLVLAGEPQFLFYEQVKQAVTSLQEDYEITIVQLGISGLGIVPDVPKQEAALSQYLGVPVSMVNDALMGLYSLLGIPKAETILVVAGTGSSVIGFKDGKTLLMGGFGHLLTEKGSAFTLVKTLISQIIEKYEQRLPFTRLEKRFMELNGISSVYDFKPFVYLKNKAKMADYAKFISAEASNNDPDAIKILKQAGKDLAYFVIKTHQHLNMQASFWLGFRGSFIQNALFVKEELMSCLKNDGLKPRLVEEENDSVIGAYYLAKQKGLI